jgi:aconitate decarboxylase
MDSSFGRRNVMTANGEQTRTAQLATWASTLHSDDIPPTVRDRAAHLVLDGIGCALVGAQLPWSRIAVEATLEFEGSGAQPIIGWGRTASAPAAALLNGTFIQGFELDDYHPLAPVHTTSLLVPALFAAAGVADGTVRGKDFIRAAVIGFEVAPRIGLALHGADMLTRGWHSGPVFGTPAVAAAVGNLLELDPVRLEHAIALGATQACGLMAAQYGAMSKRMHSGFAARNGLYGALLARRGYTGIHDVFDLPWGGYLSVFGEGHDPDASQLTNELGERWETERIVIKPYAAQGGLHAAIDIILDLCRDRDLRPEDIEKVEVDLSQPIYHHSWWNAERPLAAMGAQMHIGYAVAVALLDRQVLARQFAPDRINSDDIWNLLPKVTATHRPDFDTAGPIGRGQTEVRVTLSNRKELADQRFASQSAMSPMSNDNIVRKFRALTCGVIDVERQDAIVDQVTALDGLDDLAGLTALLADPVCSPFELTAS